MNQLEGPGKGPSQCLTLSHHLSRIPSSCAPNGLCRSRKTSRKLALGVETSSICFFFAISLASRRRGRLGTPEDAVEAVGGFGRQGGCPTTGAGGVGQSSGIKCPRDSMTRREWIQGASSVGGTLLLRHRLDDPSGESANVHDFF